MSATDDRLSELGKFLKARRDELVPDQVGMRSTGNLRRVPGLRREEVAHLAAISVDYYTRLEQGRVQASASVLSTLVQALRLSEDQQAYLYGIAGKTDARPRQRRPQRLRPAVRRLLDQLDETPAMVFGRYMDILAWNDAATSLFIDFAEIPERQRNYLRLLFTHPVMRNLHTHWQQDARNTVAALRMEAGQDPHDPELARLVGELSLQDQDFRTWWAEHRVNVTAFATKHYTHPVVGELELDCDVWESPDDISQRLLVFTAPPGTLAHDSLRILAASTVTQPIRSLAPAG